MEIAISVINVGNGDSIIVELTKDGGSFVMLIDGGKKSDAENILSKLAKTLKRHSKLGPDLIVCTHYDNDHIGGLEQIIKAYGNKINRLWLFNTTQLNSLSQQNFERSESILPSESDPAIGSSYMGKAEESILTTLIQTVEQEKSLLSLADQLKIRNEEPLAGVSIEGWEEISILGPTAEYYAALFPKTKNFEQNLKEEIEILLTENNNTKASEDPCEDLDADKSPISRVNMCSAIIQIVVNNKKYLFTGDAGVSSFKSIPNYEELLKDVYWLKVPHHGSKNNIDHTLLEIMNPEIAAISGERYISASLVRCMQERGIKVFVTRDNDDLNFKFNHS